MNSNEELWSKKEIAEHMKFSIEHIGRRIVSQPDFPTPVYLTTSKAHPRWKAGEVMEWITERRSKAA